MKVCTKCGENKPEGAFKRDRSKADGLYSSCKACVRLYRQSRAKEISDYNAQYRAKNLAYFREYNRAYYWANPEFHRERRRRHTEQKPHIMRAWRVANRDRNRETARRWRENNLERKRAIGRRSEAKRRALKFGAEGDYTESEFKAKYEAYSGRCHWCHKHVPYSEVHRDHLIALTKGGGNGIGNIVPSCPECNFSKNNRMPWEFMPGRLL